MMPLLLIFIFCLTSLILTRDITYLALQECALEVFNNDGRSHFLIFEINMKNKVYNKSVYYNCRVHTMSAYSSTCQHIVQQYIAVQQFSSAVQHIVQQCQHIMSAYSSTMSAYSNCRCTHNVSI